MTSKDTGTYALRPSSLPFSLLSPFISPLFCHPSLPPLSDSPCKKFKFKSNQFFPPTLQNISQLTPPSPSVMQFRGKPTDAPPELRTKYALDTVSPQYTFILDCDNHARLIHDQHRSEMRWENKWEHTIVQRTGVNGRVQASVKGNSVATTWSSLPPKNSVVVDLCKGQIEIGSSGDFVLQRGVHGISVKVTNDSLAVRVYGLTPGATLSMGERIVEAFAFKLQDAQEVGNAMTEAMKPIVPVVSILYSSNEVEQLTSTWIPVLPEANAFQTIFDPTLEPVIAEYEMKLRTGDVDLHMQFMMNSIEFQTLLNRVADVIDRANRLCVSTHGSGMDEAADEAA